MFSIFKKKSKKSESKKVEQPKVEPPKPIGLSDSEKIKVLEQMVIEQRLMTRQTIRILNMLAEHKRYELLQVELQKLANMLDKIK